MMTKSKILHLEVWRSLNAPWQPPFPYKADEKEIEYARQAIYDVMDLFEATVQEMDKYTRPDEPHWTRGWHEAFEQMLGHIRAVKASAERIAP